MTRNKRRDRITVEKVGDDCLDARELQRARVFRDTWITVRPSLRCPGIVQMRAARYLILLELLNQVGTQRIACPGSLPPFRRIAALASLSVWARGKAVQRNGRAIRCRCVGNPMYASQCKSTKDRRHFEACKLRLRLGGVASEIAAPFHRPRGMHKKTYIRMRARIAKLEEGLSARFKSKPADYPNLVYYLP